MKKQGKKKEAKKTGTEKGKEEATGAKPEIVEKGKKISEDLDNIMDKIDDVLEENAEEFVKNYVQKGGE